MTNKIQYNKFVCEFYNELNKNIKISNLVFLCIGTDRITGDCFGPIVGAKLKKKFLNSNKSANVYGTLENPVVSTNLESNIKKIYNENISPFIIAIDAALSNKENIGKIIVESKPMETGKGIKKHNFKIGNISIKAIIGRKEKNIKKSMELLQNISLNMVLNMADTVSNGIIEVLNDIYV